MHSNREVLGEPVRPRSRPTRSSPPRPRLPLSGSIPFSHLRGFRGLAAIVPPPAGPEAQQLGGEPGRLGCPLCPSVRQPPCRQPSVNFTGPKNQPPKSRRLGTKANQVHKCNLRVFSFNSDHIFYLTQYVQILSFQHTINTEITDEICEIIPWYLIMNITYN